MNKKELLEATFEEENQKDKVMLKDIPVGGKFDTGIGRFIVLGQKENYTAVLQAIPPKKKRSRLWKCAETGTHGAK